MTNCDLRKMSPKMEKPMPASDCMPPKHSKGGNQHQLNIFLVFASSIQEKKDIGLGKERKENKKEVLLPLPLSSVGA